MATAVEWLALSRSEATVSVASTWMGYSLLDFVGDQGNARANSFADMCLSRFFQLLFIDPSCEYIIKLMRWILREL